MAGENAARVRALAVLRVRSTALAVALLPAAVAVVVLVAFATGRVGGQGWDALRWTLTGVGVAALLLAAGAATVIVRARPAVSPTVPVPEETAPELYRMVRDLAGRLDVPAPSAIALTPDCDSWLEDRSHLPGGRVPAAGQHGARRPRTVPRTPVLVIGSPFMWWMRVAELRALLAPVVAGTGPSADPDIAAARRFVRGLDAAVAVCAQPGTTTAAGAPSAVPAVLRRPVLRIVGFAARLMLRGCRVHIAEMERAVAAVAAENAQTVDYGLRIVAQEQVGLAYAGWDRLLTRVALPAWRMGRWPARLDAGVVSALTELSRRDRLAEGFETRLGERPACDLLDRPGAVDEAASLLAARLFHGPGGPGGWSPVSWEAYPQEVVDRIWRSDAARLHRALDELSPPPGAVPRGPQGTGRATLARVLDRLAQGGSDELAARIGVHQEREERRREEVLAAEPPAVATPGDALSADPFATAPVGPEGDPPTPFYQLLPPRTGRDLLADHVTAMVCCAAVDTAGAVPGLDWLDGPALMVGGTRRTDLASPVLRLVEHGDPAPLRAWLSTVGVRLEKPVRLV